MSSTLSLNRIPGFVRVLALGVSCLAFPAFASGNGCEERVNAQTFEFSVAMPDGNSYGLTGVMYWLGQLDGKVLQVALHGGTYNHKYWDADDVNGHPYSYARYMACHGFAVLALDNLGAGASSKPNGDLIDPAFEALAVHQIIQGLGSAPVAHKFRKIVLVGHSMGSLEAVFLQGTYHDADALIVTGWENTPHALPFPPEFFAALMSEPYVFFPPFARTMVFYAGNFDPAVAEYDNANLLDLLPRALFTYTLAATAGTAPTMSEGVTGPVLLVFAEYDAFEPVSVAASEPATYPNASSVTTHIVYKSGHDLNLHLSNVEEWARMKGWIRQNVGDDTAEGD